MKLILNLLSLCCGITFFAAMFFALDDAVQAISIKQSPVNFSKETWTCIAAALLLITTYIISVLINAYKEAKKEVRNHRTMCKVHNVW